eukprot:6482324-Amphidinium_carterae.1
MRRRFAQGHCSSVREKTLARNNNRLALQLSGTNADSIDLPILGSITGKGCPLALASCTLQNHLLRSFDQPNHTPSDMYWEGTEEDFEDFASTAAEHSMEEAVEDWADATEVTELVEAKRGPTARTLNKPSVARGLRCFRGGRAAGETTE